MVNRLPQKVKLSPMMRYLLYSILVTIIDTVVVWVMYRGMGIHVVVSNTTGVIIGFVIHYLLSSKAVFDTELGVQGFLIYLGTFLMGLGLADLLIYTGEKLLFTGLEDNLSFLLSKGLSIVVPFFFLYFLRRILFELLRRYQYAHKKIT